MGAKRYTDKFKIAANERDLEGLDRFVQTVLQSSLH